MKERENIVKIYVINFRNNNFINFHAKFKNYNNNNIHDFESTSSLQNKEQNHGGNKKINW